MALITCPECEKEISSQAKNCPNCGYPIQEEKENIQRLTATLTKISNGKIAPQNVSKENTCDIQSVKKACLNCESEVAAESLPCPAGMQAANNSTEGCENPQKGSGNRQKKFRVLIAAALIFVVSIAIFAAFASSPESIAKRGAKKILQSDGFSTVLIDSVSIRENNDASKLISADITVMVPDGVSANNVYYSLHDGESEILGKRVNFDNISVMNGSRELVIQNNKPKASDTSKSENSSTSTPASPSQPYSPPETLENKSTAQFYAEYFVKQQLKSPSTAEFPSYDKYTYDFKGNTWTVSGYVDSQNSFGANLRSNWTVTFTVSGSDYENASLDSIDFE